MRKLYKFRPLSSEEDLNRIQNILATNHFWCSRFWDLNDPTEGIFLAKNSSHTDAIFSEKKKYMICSFSGEIGFKNPTLWGYYANGFKGVAIEIETKIPKKDGNIPDKRRRIKMVDYKNGILDSANSPSTILTAKREEWWKEDEYRFLTESNCNYQKIGKISAVYLGEPFGHAANRADIIEKSKTLKEYIERKDRLITIIKEIYEGAAVAEQLENVGENIIRKISLRRPRNVKNVLKDFV